MIPIPPVSLRLYVELALLVLLVIATGTSVTYRALYKAADTRATAQLSSAAAESAKLTAEALHLAYADQLARAEEDRLRSEQAAQDAVARATRAERSVSQLRRDLRSEANSDACVGRDLSERTRERLRDLEQSYSGRSDEG